MRFRVDLLFVAFTVVQAVTPSVGVTQEIQKIPRIGFLGPGWGFTPEQYAQSPWLQALRTLGWIEGKTVVFEWRYAEGQPDRLPSLAAGLGRIPVDVIVADTPPAALAAKNATATIPIMFMGVSDPVGLGLVKSLARPGGNITGFSIVPGPEVSAKQLEFLKEVVPSVRRVAWLVDGSLVPTAPTPVQSAIEAAARRLGLELRQFEVQRPEDFERAFAAMLAWPAEALFLPGGVIFVHHRPKIVEFTLKHRIPATFGMWQLAEAGGLISYYPNHRERIQRWAATLDKILRGANPGEIPVEQPARLDLVINLKTAKALGLTIPPSLLQRADQIIE